MVWPIIASVGYNDYFGQDHVKNHCLTSIIVIKSYKNQNQSRKTENLGRMTTLYFQFTIKELNKIRLLTTPK